MQSRKLHEANQVDIQENHAGKYKKWSGPMRYKDKGNASNSYNANDGGLDQLFHGNSIPDPKKGKMRHK